MYRKLETKKGVRWLKDGKLISVKNVPQEELDKCDKAVFDEKHCLFCGVPAKLTRYLNMQTVVLCEQHYYSETLGKIAQELAKKL